VGGVADTQDQTATPCVSASKRADADGVIDLHPAGPTAGAFAAQDAGKNASDVDIGAARTLTDNEIMKPNPLYGRFRQKVRPACVRRSHWRAARTL
jgi:hypothetical protein